MTQTITQGYLDRPIFSIVSQAARQMGVRAFEMEAPALYMNAARSGARALCLCTISDSLVTGEVTTAEERQNNFTQMMDVAFGII